MKALVIRQPWAELIASDQKSIETRTWHTNYRGDLLIVAGKQLDREAAALFMLPEKSLVLGQAVAIVRVYACEPMIKEHEAAAMCPVYPKAWAWSLANVRRIMPFPVKGRLGFFEVSLTGEQP